MEQKTTDELFLPGLQPVSDEEMTAASQQLLQQNHEAYEVLAQ